MEATASYLLILQKYINSNNYALCLGNILKDFTINNKEKKKN